MTMRKQVLAGWKIVSNVVGLYNNVCSLRLSNFFVFIFRLALMSRVCAHRDLRAQNATVCSHGLYYFHYTYECSIKYEFERRFF